MKVLRRLFLGYLCVLPSVWAVADPNDLAGTWKCLSLLDAQTRKSLESQESIFFGKSDITGSIALQMSAAEKMLRKLIEENYSYYELCGVDWDKVFLQYGSRLNHARTPEQFAQNAARMLSRTRDKHISVYAGDEYIKGLRKDYFCNYNLKTIKLTNSRKFLTVTGADS